MCEIEGTEMDAATRSNVRAGTDLFKSLDSIFAAAFKREHEKQAKYQAKPDDDEQQPESEA